MPASLKPEIRLLAIVAICLAFVLGSPGFALAQTGPASTQYVGEAVEDAADNAGQGTGAVNEALSEPGAPATTSSSTPAGGGAATAASPAADETEGGETGDGADGPEAISELPETGGASATMFGAGALLVTFGLAMRRVI